MVQQHLTTIKITDLSEAAECLSLRFGRICTQNLISRVTSKYLCFCVTFGHILETKPPLSIKPKNASGTKTESAAGKS